MARHLGNQPLGPHSRHVKRATSAIFLSGVVVAQFGCEEPTGDDASPIIWDSAAEFISTVPVITDDQVLFATRNGDVIALADLLSIQPQIENAVEEEDSVSHLMRLCDLLTGAVRSEVQTDVPTNEMKLALRERIRTHAGVSDLARDRANGSPSRFFVTVIQ